MSDDPYREALLYDLEYAGHVEDRGWYVRQAREAGGRVLELGCGTGRLTLPIARAGVAITGMDRAGAMLDGLRRKLAREPALIRERVQILAGDYLAADPGHGFSAVLWPFNAIHHLDGPEQVRTMLQRIRSWLGPGGFLALDSYLPDLQLYDRDPDRRYEPRAFVDPRTGEVLDSWEQGWWDDAARVHHVLYVYEHADGRQERSHLALRMYDLPELHALLADEGWSVTQEASDFDGRSLGPDALKWVAVARP